MMVEHIVLKEGATSPPKKCVKSKINQNREGVVVEGISCSIFFILCIRVIPPTHGILRVSD